MSIGPPKGARPALAVAVAVASLGTGGGSTAQEGPVPVLGRSVNVALVSGTVLIKPKGQKRFRKLTGSELIPTGSTIDTRRGRVRLTSAVNTKGAIRTADFWAGVFRVTQRRKTKAVTDLILNGKLENCSRTGTRSSAAARKRKGRRLWGGGKGKFRTRGRRSSALVRGTVWLVYDQCDSSTYNAVRKGKVDVRDFRRKKTIRLKAGGKYIAR